MTALPLPEDAGESVGIFEAKTHLSDLVARVQAGERITITKHGRAVAMLVAPEPSRDRKAVRERIAAWRETFAERGVQLTREEIRAMIDEGRP